MRLTFRNHDGQAYTNSEPASVIEKLSKYEDMEEQNRLLILPISPGTEVYLTDYYCTKKEDEKCPHECQDCEYSKKFIVPFTPTTKEQVAIITRALGSDCFLTKEEAEKAISKKQVKSV